MLSSLVIQEKSTRDLADGGRKPHHIGQGDPVNAFSILEIALKTDSVDKLGALKENLIVVVDLRKKGEQTWNRVEPVNRLSRRLEPTTAYLPGHPELLAAGPIPPLYVNDAALGKETFLQEGDIVTWLAFNDVSSAEIYLEDLKETAKREGAVLAVNLQQVPLRSAGGTTEQYEAHDGDDIRISILSEAYTPARAYDVALLAKINNDQDKGDFFMRLIHAAQSISDRTVRDDILVAQCISAVAGTDATAKAALESVRKDLSGRESKLLKKLLNDRQDTYSVRIADILAPEEEVVLDLLRFGVKVDLSPVIALGRRAGPQGTVNSFNPIKTTPSIGSNVYSVYDGRKGWFKALNVLPGVHMSLLGLGDGSDAEFTLGLVHPVLPGLRHHFGVFYSWHDLKDPVWGFTFSPSINFRGLVGAEK